MTKKLIYFEDALDALCNDYCGGHQDCKYYPNCENLKSIEQLPSAQPEIIRCKDCKHWTQSMGKMKGYGLGRCNFHDADLVTCNGYCYWAERRTDD